MSAGEVTLIGALLIRSFRVADHVLRQRGGDGAQAAEATAANVSFSSLHLGALLHNDLLQPSFRLQFEEEGRGQQQQQRSQQQEPQQERDQRQEQQQQQQVGMANVSASYPCVLSRRPTIFLLQCPPNATLEDGEWRQRLASALASSAWFRELASALPPFLYFLGMACGAALLSCIRERCPHLLVFLPGEARRRSRRPQGPDQTAGTGVGAAAAPPPIPLTSVVVVGGQDDDDDDEEEDRRSYRVREAVICAARTLYYNHVPWCYYYSHATNNRKDGRKNGSAGRGAEKKKKKHKKKKIYVHGLAPSAFLRQHTTVL